MLNYPHLKKTFNILKSSVVLSSLLTSAALADVYSLAPGQDVVGEIQTTHSRYEDTFLILADKFDVAYQELIAANPGIDAWVPGANTQITIPSRYVLPSGPREGIVINLPELRIYYFSKDGKQVYTYPIAIGTEETPTPLFSGHVTTKAANPTWYVPDSIYEKHMMAGTPIPHVVPAGEANPLGKYALHLTLAGYLIHGTNKPNSVGQRISNGCIRLYPKDIQELFSVVTPGAPVRIVNEPVKVGWDNGTLLLETHPPLSEDGMAEEDEMNTAIQEIKTATIGHPAQVELATVEKLIRARSGIPAAIGEGNDGLMKVHTAQAAE